MSMSNYPQYADTVSKDFVKEICSKEYEDFVIVLAQIDVSFDDFCIYLHQGYDNLDVETEEQQENMDHAWYVLKTAFDNKTGLELFVVYANAEDRGDELDGSSFAVDKVYQYTPAGEKYKDKINRKCWNVFG